MAEITLISKCQGLNNNADPASLPYNPQAGIGWLTSCNNVFIGDSGRINRCIGKTQILSGNCNSLFASADHGIFGTGKYLKTVTPSGSVSTILEKTEDDTVFESINTGSGDVNFWTDGVQNGRVIAGMNNTWVKGDYYGPATTRKFKDPPTGHLLAWTHGQMWVASGQHIFRSEPGNPYLFNYHSGRLSYGSRVRMIGGVSGGVWVSDSDQIFFISGIGTPNMIQERMAPYPAFEGTPSKVGLNTLPFPNVPGNGLIVPTQKGICYLGHDGTFLNLTERNLELRASDRGFLDATRFSGIIDRNRYYVNLFGGSESVSLIHNLNNNAVTQAQVYQNNSIAKIKDLIYFANSDGIYALSDAAVDAEFTFGVNIGRTCRFRFLYVTGEFAGNCQITVVSDENISKTYALTPNLTSNKQHKFRIPIRRDNGIGSFWTFKFENTSGSDFSVDRISATPVFRGTYNSL